MSVFVNMDEKLETVAAQLHARLRKDRRRLCLEERRWTNTKLEGRGCKIRSAIAHSYNFLGVNAWEEDISNVAIGRVLIKVENVCLRHFLHCKDWRQSHCAENL